jgi:transposase
VRCSSATRSSPGRGASRRCSARSHRAPNRDDAERRLAQFLTAVEQAQLRPLDAFAKGITQWRSELLAYFEEPTTNGYADGVINKVKVIKRRAYGLPTFAGFRKRVVIACG